LYECRLLQLTYYQIDFKSNYNGIYIDIRKIH
jgi:hypothetical protein